MQVYSLSSYIPFLDLTVNSSLDTHPDISFVFISICECVYKCTCTYIYIEIDCVCTEVWKYMYMHTLYIDYILYVVHIYYT